MDGDGGGYNDGGYGGGDDYTVRSPAYNDNARDDLPFEPVNRNNDPFSATDDTEEKYRLERERVAILKETDVDEIRPCDDEDHDHDHDRSSTDGRNTGGLAVMLGGSLANSVIDGLADKNDGVRNGKTPYSAFGVSGRERSESDLAQDCVYYSVLCCQCSIL